MMFFKGQTLGLAGNLGKPFERQLKKDDPAR
jgi:hypothetical protein